MFISQMYVGKMMCLILLSPKIFFTETSTGKVQVPRSLSGGECGITTSTGDIKLEIAE